MNNYSQKEKISLIQKVLQGNFSCPKNKNIGEFKSRKLLAYINILGVEDLQKILEICMLPGDALPIYPSSTGKNWGLGSFLPVQENGIVLDLSRMNAILDLNLNTGLAVIEPGVTQQQLSEALIGSSYMLNVTSSYTATSVLGNALDRGVGFHRQRDQDLIGFDLLLPSGKYVKWGVYWSLAGGAMDSFHYKNGVGPNMLPLLFQSNFGIVTKGVISLLPRPEKIIVLKITFEAGKLDNILHLFQKFYQEETIKSVMKIYNASAATMYSGRNHLNMVDRFCGYFSVEGPADICDAKSKRIMFHVEQLDHLCEEVKSDTKDILSRMVYECFHGNPAYNDAMINASFKVKDCEIDACSPQGWISFLPIIPFDIGSLHQAFSLIQQCTQGTPIRSMATMNILSRTAVDLVVALRFKRDAYHIEMAHRILDDLYTRFCHAGFYPYRLDVDHMDFPLQDRQGPVYRQLLQDIKNVFDPHNIIMPGRYGI